MTVFFNLFVRIFGFIVVFSNCVHCYDVKFKSNLLDIKRISYEFFSENNFNMSNGIIETISRHNWTENQECLGELYEIKNGIDNFEDWALESK